ALPPVCQTAPRIRDIAFPDQRNMLTWDRDGTLQWWDLPTRRLIATAVGQRLGGNTVMALSADGRTLVTGGPERRVLRWDLATRRPLEPELHQDAPVEAIALGPDGRTVITGRRAGRLHVWDGETECGFDLPPQGTAVTQLAVSPDGRVFASG